MASTAVPPRRRRYVERPDVRTQLLDAAEALFREEGYAAATARSIATRAGLKHQVVFYYFGSQDELLLALLKRIAGTHRQRLEAALQAEHPISAMWQAIRDPHATRLTLEFMALANHNEAIRAELARNADEVRVLETQAIARHLQQRGIKPRLSPELVSILTNALARLLVQESALGISRGHDEVDALVDLSFRHFESRGDSAAAVEPIVAPMSREQAGPADE